jgi:hypothetical protein
MRKEVADSNLYECQPPLFQASPLFSLRTSFQALRAFAHHGLTWYLWQTAPWCVLTSCLFSELLHLESFAVLPTGVFRMTLVVHAVNDECSLLVLPVADQGPS